MRSRSLVGILVGSIALIGLVGCSTTTSGSLEESPSNAPKLSGTITVYGAASLTASFTELAQKFEAENPGVTVQSTFNGSSVLVTQIEAGAPADVFASADEPNMTKLTTAKLTKGTPIDFATNTLEIAVPVGNPARITSFADLAKPGVKTVICAAPVPCGAATVAIEKATGVILKPVSEETAVTGVLTKVESGEADAGLVYVTDVKSAAGKVDGVTFADADKAVNTYPIVALKESKNPELAKAFVDFVTGQVGERVLTAAGFGTP